MNKEQRTLNSNVYVVLRLLCLPSILIGFGERVCRKGHMSAEVPIAKSGKESEEVRLVCVEDNVVVCIQS